MQKQNTAKFSLCILSCPFLQDYDVDYNNILGEGGFGSVYYAIEKITKKPCAIKFLQDKNDGFRSKMKEIKILEEARNGHIIRMFDYYEDEKNNFVIFSIELASGSLDNQRKSMNSGFKKRLLIQFIADVLTGLLFSHSKGISHNDIKPGNILYFSLDREKIKGLQTLWTFDHKVVYKLADWGSGHMQTIDETVTMRTDVTKTKAYAAPELTNYEGRLRLNLFNCDIYSFGLCILYCCGVEQKFFCELNNTFDKKKHEKTLKTLMRKANIEEKYGEKIYELIRQMVQFHSSDRIDTFTIQKRLKEIIKEEEEIIEEEENQCGICKKLHNEKNRIELLCGHWLGKQCSRGKLLEFIIPRCGNADCTEPVGLLLETSKEILGEDLKDLIRICKGCGKENYRFLFIELENCLHKFCKECCETVEESGKCLLRSCKEKISKKDVRKIEEFDENCAVCKRTFEGFEIKEQFKLRCCKSLLCVDCLKIHVYHHFLWARQEDSSIFCIVCRKDLKDREFENILFKSSFDYFAKEILQWRSCEKCKNYQKKSAFRELPCGHQICRKCLKSHLEINSRKLKVKWPVKDCEEIINENLAKEQNLRANSICNTKNSSSELVSSKHRSTQKKEEVKEEGKIEENPDKISHEQIISKVIEERKIEENPEKISQKFPQKKEQIISKVKEEERKLEENPAKLEKSTTKNSAENPKICEKCAFCEKPYEIKLEACGHLFCRDCLRSHLIARIDKQNFFLDCPSGSCFLEIPYYLIKNLLRNEYFGKYDNFLFKNNRFFMEENDKKDGKPTFCPNKDCVLYQKTVYTCENARFFPCDACGKSFCVNKDCGGEELDHIDRTCEEFKQGLGKNSEKNEDLQK